MSRNGVFIGMGSNRGDRARHLREARRCLRRRGGRLRCSAIRETRPVGVHTRRYFLNQVIEWIDCPFDGPETCLCWLLDTERELGRNRRRGGPDREIDLDLLYWGSMIRAADPILPHPRLHRRRFVLEPMVELAPDFVHPVFQKTQRQLLQEWSSGRTRAT